MTESPSRSVTKVSKHDVPASPPVILFDSVMIDIAWFGKLVAVRFGNTNVAGRLTAVYDEPDGYTLVIEQDGPDDDSWHIPTHLISEILPIRAADIDGPKGIGW